MPANEIPWSIKLLHTAFVGILVPAYWAYYGPVNFLWFSDIALLISVAALWMRSSLLASSQAVGVVALEMGWITDLAMRLVAGFSPIGLGDYMFEPTYPWWIKALSLFHLWLPFLLLWSVYCYGYDRRAWLVQSIIAAVVLPLSYLLSDPEQNVNWVYGLGGRPQTLLPDWLFVLMLVIGFPLFIYWPSHLVLNATMRRGA